MDIGPNLHVLRTERNIYISNSQNDGTGGTDRLDRVCNRDECCEPDVCCDSNECCEHFVIEKTCGKFHKFPKSVEHPYSQYSIRASKAAERQYLHWPNDALK